MMITNVLWKQLIIGWSMGLIVSTIGLYLSYIADLPSGPTVVSFYGLMLILVALYLYIFRAEKRNKALMRVAMGTGIVIVAIIGIFLLGNLFASSSSKHIHHDIDEEKTHSHFDYERNRIENMSESELDIFLSYESDVDHLIEIYNEADEYNKFKVASRILGLNKKLGFSLLVDILQNGELPFVKEQVNLKIEEVSGKDFGYDPINDTEDNRRAINRMNAWKEKL
jgi:hypothetical protein